MGLSAAIYGRCMVNLPQRFRSARLVPSLTAFVLATALAGCDGSSESAGGIATLDGATDEVAVEEFEIDQADAVLAFVACMRDAGVEMDDPTFDAEGNVEGGFGLLQAGGGRGGGDEETQTATASCSDLLEGVTLGGNNRSGFDTSTIEDALLDYTSCLREEGQNVDDISFGFGGGGGAPGGADTDGADGAGAGTATDEDGTGGGFQGGGGRGAPGEDGGGEREGGGGAGFDPTARMVAQLELDDTDPEVAAALEVCEPLLSSAFSGTTEDADGTTDDEAADS